MIRSVFARFLRTSCAGAVTLTLVSVGFSSALMAAPASGGPRQLVLLHQLDADRHQALSELATRFNQSRQDFVVRVEAGSWQEGAQAHMLITEGEAAERFLAARTPRYKPVHAAMREAGLPLQAVKPPPVVPRHTVDAQGRLLALPVGMSTPVLYVNRDALRRAGLNPDMPLQTWSGLQEALDRLFDAGSTCPYTVAEPGRVMIENASAWHNEPVTRTEARRELPRFNGMLQIKHVALMASWHRAQFMRIYPDAREAESRFARGECATIAASSSSWPSFRRQGGFELGIASLPYHDDMPGAPQNTLADGAMLWLTAGHKPAEYKAMAAFVNFWLQPENQVHWQRETGYLPLNRSGFLAAESDLLGDDLENIRVAVAQLVNKRTTPASSASILTGQAGTLRLVDQALEDVWSGRKPAKQALDEAVMQLQMPAR